MTSAESKDSMAGEDAATRGVYRVFSKYMEPLGIADTLVVTAAMVFVEECKERERPFGSVAECTAFLDETLSDVIEGDGEEELAEEVAEGLVGQEVVYGKDRETSIFDIPMKVGDACLAVLKEDGDWHEAKVDAVLDDGRYRVVFAEFGKPQDVAKDEIVAEEAVEGEEKDESGTCPMCKRVMPLTKHHVVPRTTWPRYRKKGWAVADLVKTEDICRPCHSAVHRAEDEYSLAKDWNTLEKLMTHPELIRWMKWASTQKVIAKADARNQKLRHKR